MSMVYRVFIGRYAHLFVCKAVAVDQGEYAIRAWHGCARCRSPHPRSQVLLLPANTWRGSADSPTATRLGYPLEQGACTEAHSSPQQSRCGLAQAVSSGRPRQGRLDKFPPDHGIAFNAHQVDVRRSHVQKLVEGETFFQVIRCRRWEACWHLKGVQREVSSAWIEGSEDGDHDEKRLYCIFVQLSALPALVNRVDSRYDNRLATHTPGHFLAHLKGLCDTK